MRIIQLSDLHISTEKDFPNGVDVRDNFRKAVQLIPEFNPDFLVISGDLSYRRGSKSIYTWIKDQLKHLELRVYAISGNHDDSILLAETFHPEKTTSSSGKLYYFSRKQEELFLFLDTWDGYLDPQQSKWMQDTLNKYDCDRLFVFMHHPPLKADVPHMDGKYAFKDITAFREITRNFGRPVYVFAGHYHIHKSLHLENMHVFIAPSTFFHLKGDQPEFIKDHSIPGIQLIDIDALKVSVHAHYVFP